ncbi:hypothetical protein HMPREF1320_1496 [Capnocytophaga sp. oral taxon 335 str. F0486]|nr:hypothetical protein HMPREF1320_1496 [Capnocytophaga sp. oral taxon 335 str. F0486]
MLLEGDLQIAPTKYTEKATDYQCINLLRVVARRGESYTSR